MMLYLSSAPLIVFIEKLNFTDIFVNGLIFENRK